jgi:hypothetical protein
MIGMPRVASWACAGRVDGAMVPQATAKAVAIASVRVAGARSHDLLVKVLLVKVLLVLPLSIMPVCKSQESGKNGANLLAPCSAVNAASNHD